jgi:ADP-ribose pyrophosphatase YjhB (NUDIX family)
VTKPRRQGWNSETHEEALKREVKEETDMDVKAISKLLFQFSDHENKFEVYFYKAEATGQPKTKEPEKLNSKWVYLELDELRKKDTVPALTELLKKISNL